jgi:hypothetical protein
MWAVALIIGGLLLFTISWVTSFNATWLLAVLAVTGGMTLAARVEAADSKAAYEAAVNALQEDQ